MAAPEAITQVQEPQDASEQPETAQAPAAKPAKAKKKAKDKGERKAAKAPEPALDGAPSIVAHPRAVRSIARAKGWGGLGGFLIAGYLSLPTSTLAGAALRAILAGVTCYVVVWGAAVFVWRRLVVLELKAREAQLRQQVEAALGARAQAPAGARAGARDAP